MNEAVNYIEYLKKSIQELSVKRDEIKMLSNLSALDEDLGNASSSSDKYCSLTNCVAVHPFWGGLEIVINSCFGDETLHLSTVMQVILEEGLDVVRCVSSQTNQGFLHSIYSEVYISYLYGCSNYPFNSINSTPSHH